MAHSSKFFVFIIITTIIMTGCASGPSTQLAEEYGPPALLIKQHDHAALAKWYTEEAIALRQRAKEIRSMVREVRDYDSQGFYVDRLDIMKEGSDLADDYSEAADRAEKLAQIHRR